MVDVIRSPTRCGLFRPGHDVHWIQGLKAGNDPTPPRPARVEVLSDGWVRAAPRDRPRVAPLEPRTRPTRRGAGGQRRTGLPSHLRFARMLDDEPEERWVGQRP